MSFTFFPRLPTEIRLQIWNEAIPPGRILRVLLTHELETFVYPFEPYRTPAILHVCQESRDVGLSIFRHDLGTRCNDHFWWNPRVDTVFRTCLAPVNPPGYSAPDFVPSEDEPTSPEHSFKMLQYMQNTRHLAIPLTLSTLEFLSLDLLRTKDIKSPQWLRQFPRLKTLILLLDPLADWIRMGDIVISTLRDSPIPTLDGDTPSEVVTMVGQSLELFGLSAKSDWMAPAVEVFVLTIGTMGEEEGFWLPKPKKRKGWMV